ncbi:hypothetical protein V2J09_002928 [Rumex salicifolius]
MATAKESVSVKSLNWNPGRRNRRFVFKTFRDRIAETEIDVFHSLNHLKAEPSNSTFFLDCLIQWRELNTAEDFISLYEDMMPLTQTLPLVLLHKELVISKLISKLNMEARLSLEPILRLVAELARDLLEDFIPFLPKLMDSFLDLLNNGADKEPETIEQIFTSLSHIIMYLQKYLSQDIALVLRHTRRLIYYQKDFVQEFMAEVVSFLLRNAPSEQLRIGIKKVVSEVVKKPSKRRKYGVTAILWHIMRGTASKFHSKAEKVLQMLTDGSLFIMRLCIDMNPEELRLMWNCLYCGITNCLNNQRISFLNCLLSVLISNISFENGRKVFGYNTLLVLVNSLIEKFFRSPIGLMEDQMSKVVSQILQLMSCTLDGLHTYSDIPTISIAAQWTLAFELTTPSLLSFLKELVHKDPVLLFEFRNNILSVCQNLMKTSEDEIVYLILTFCERLQLKAEGCTLLEGIDINVVLEISHFIQGEIRCWINKINVVQGNSDSFYAELDDTKLPVLWGIIRCYPSFVNAQEDASLLMDLVDVIDQLLMAKSDISQQSWQCLIGAALTSYHKLHASDKDMFAHTSRILGLVKRELYKSSPHILCAVADFLDLIDRSTFEANATCRIKHPELESAKLRDALHVFADNLLDADKRVRVSTLRMLCHYETLADEQQSESHSCTENRDNNQSDICCNVLQLLLSIEETPASVHTSRKLTLLVSRIQTELSGGKIPKDYIPVVMKGVVGIFHNQFRDLSISALECLAVLLDKYYQSVWDSFLLIFEKFLNYFSGTSHEDIDINADVDSSIETKDIAELFHRLVNIKQDRNSSPSVLPFLIQALQKTPIVVEARSRQMIPLFLRFLGYEHDNGVGLFNSRVCKEKDWKVVLIEWLSLLQVLKNPRSFYHSQFLKEILVNRFLDEIDAVVQMKVLECLLNWKDDFLIPYSKHLKNLISSKTLREELATWSLSNESDLIEVEHRRKLVPYVIRLLMPKIRNLKTLASRKHASLSGRRAILGYISQLHVGELPLFYAMLMKPLQMMEEGSDSNMKWFWDTLEITMDEFQSIDFFKFFTLEKTMTLPWKKKYGFLHVVEDILGVFDESRVRPFLNMLAGCVVRILFSCYIGLLRARNDECNALGNHSMVDTTAFEKDDEIISVKHIKDLRSLCLKIVSNVISKYEDHNFGSEFWALFFDSVKPLIDGFKQEGSTSEKPSSLFSCFLAMSQSQNLVSLLCRERNLVPDIFSILPVPSASEAVITCVLKFIENLLHLDAVVENENSDVRNVLLLNLEVLIDNLHCLYHLKGERKREFAKRPSEIVLRILKLISRYVKDPVAANYVKIPIAAKKFVDILLPLLGSIAKNSDASMEALQILREVVPVLECDTTTIILGSLAPLLIVAKLDLRLSVCELLAALAQKDTSLLSTAVLVSQLNATGNLSRGGSRMNSYNLEAELDFDTIIEAYDKISEELFCGISVEHAEVILSHCIHHMTSEELLLRHSAYRSLLVFVDFSASVIGNEVAGSKVSDEKMEVDGSCWNETSIRRVIEKFLLKYMGDAFIGGLSIQKEWVDLLREMILRLPVNPKLRTLKALCSDDAEVDFFNNLTHLQMHRRARALIRFGHVVRTGELSRDVSEKLFLPLFMSMLFDIKEKDEHLRRTCLDALASLSGQMEWKSYYALLMRCFRDLTRKPERRKVLLRLISSILDEFHFIDILTDDANDSADHNGMEKEMAVASSVTQAQLQTCLLHTVFPKLQKLLLSDSDKVNVDVSLAALKVLKLLTPDIMQSHLPSIIHRIVNFLKNRLESIRDEARSALAGFLKELGAEYLPSVIRSLRATLKRGFELHVLGYTLYFVIFKGLHHSAGGELDHCLDDVLGVIRKDILEDVAEQKEVEKIASKMKETRKRMSFQTLELVAQNVSFKKNALRLLSPVQAYLQKHLTPKTKTKLNKMLKHIAAGIERNPSADQKDFFVYINGLIDDGVAQERHLCGSSSVTTASEQKHSAQSYKVARISYADVEPQGWHLITVFALQLLYNRIRNNKFDNKDIEVLEMLDPFVELLATCLKSKYEEILSATLQCISHLIKLPLPSLAILGDEIKTTLLDIAQSSSNPNSPVMETCLRLLTELLQSKKVTLSKDQLHIVVHFPIFIDLERNPSFVVLSLLKAIVRCKLVVPEIYDLASEVAKLMITSQIGPVRKRCSQILLQFLLNYQLNQKRMNQHFDFLINSLRYEHATGREAVLEMLRVIIERFPQRVIDEWSLPLFLNLVNSLVHDPDNQIRSLIAADIQLLVSHVSSSSLDKILESSLAWYMGENKQLWGIAAQVLGIIVEVMKKDFQKHINSVLQLPGKEGKNRMKSILQFAVENAFELDHSDQRMITEWKEAYYSLVLFQKIMVQFPGQFFEQHVEDFWKAISELLMHPHLWIRGISSRLISLYFNQISLRNTKLGTTYLTRTDKLFRVAVSQCCQLKGGHSDANSVEVLKSNLVFALKGLHAARAIEESRDPSVFWSTLDPHEQHCFLEASQLLDSSNRRVVVESLTSSSGEDLCQLLVSSLLETMGKIALQSSEDITTKAILSCFHLVASEIKGAICKPYAIQLLLPLYRICEGFAGRVISDDLKQNAEEVRSIMQEIMGQDFVEAYKDIRSDLKFRRETKKQKEKLMAVVDPVRNAKRKLRAAFKHKANKKRKIMTMKFRRWMRQ